MNDLGDLMVDIWREACRHIRIAESSATIAELLVRQMPIDRLVIRRIDPTRSAVETVAAGLAGAGERLDPQRADLSPYQLKRLLVWTRRGEPTLADTPTAVPADAAPALPAALPSQPMLLGPLVGDHGSLGLVIVVARPRQRFTAEHERLIAQLLEPFATALDNDARLREIDALREAAEADKRSLLTRLGREDLTSEAIVGADAGLRGVMQRADLVSRSDVPALILGETGSGKEVIARAIHNRSARARGPFLRVNCGAIPPELIDSELFGHEKGAFTGATGQRRGWFERAHEGTLFLDEIGELPPAAQVRFLRVLQDGILERVGGESSINVDVRIIAATHRDLPAMVREGRFREDLWYRIAVFPIALPPLRDHKEDIPALADHFARRAATRFGLVPRSPTMDDLALLEAYDWPGNVRELGAVIDRAAILGDGHRLDIAKALGAPPGNASAPGVIPLKPGHAAPAAWSGFNGAEARTSGPLLTLDEAQKRHIELALRHAHGKIEGPGGAAALLDINPHTLRARMRKLGIRWSAFRPASPAFSIADGI